MQKVPSPYIIDVSASQIEQSGATTDQVLMWNGTVWAPGDVIKVPAVATEGQTIVYNSATHKWVAGNVINSGNSGGSSNGIDSTPIGTVVWLAVTTVPTGYLECNGNIVGQTEYADLYAALGTTFNKGGEGAGIFRLPDLRGEFIRGWDHGKGLDPARAFGSEQVDDFKSHNHITGDYNRLVKSDGVNTNDATSIDNVNGMGAEPNLLYSGIISPAGGTETRPRNIALMPCIKALKTVVGVLNYIEKPVTPTDGQSLVYSAAQSKWIPGAPASGGSDIPVGTITYFAADTAPMGYLECDGRTVARVTYSDLFAIISTKFNTGGEALTDFRLPDLRGEFVRGWDHGIGVDPARAFGSKQTESTRLPYIIRTAAWGFSTTGEINNVTGIVYTDDFKDGGPVTADWTTSQTRPRNIALLPCIKALKTTTGDLRYLNFINKPDTATNGQLLVYNTTTASWTASSVTIPVGSGSVAPGPQGPVGSPGPQGMQGVTGLTGPKGDTGGIGLQGPQGGIGPAGVQGPVGPQGLKGDVGSVGPQGPKGETGLTGPQGPQGVQGVAGATVTNTVMNNIDNTPIGTISWFAAATPPAGYLECNGAAPNRAQYPELFAVIGTIYGSTSNANFLLPDLRGEFVRGWDHGIGVDPARAFGSKQIATTISDRPIKDSLSSPNNNNGEIELDVKNHDGYQLTSHSTWQKSAVWFSMNQNSTEYSIRPRNIALLPCIKAVRTVTGNVQSLNFIPAPAGTNGQVLVYNSSTTSWVASSVSNTGASSGGGTTTIPGASLAKAWVSFVGSTGTIISSYNVTSITRRGLGLYTINFTTGTFTNTNYLYTFGVQANVVGNDSNVIGRFGTKTVNSIQISCDDDNASDNNDFAEICVVFYGAGGDINVSGGGGTGSNRITEFADWDQYSGGNYPCDAFGMIDSEKTVRVFGNNVYNRFGTQHLYANPCGTLPLPAGELASKLYITTVNVAVITQSGNVYMSGRNTEGQCGDGTALDRVDLVKVTGLPTNVIDIIITNEDSGGTANTIYALTSDGRLYAWGYNQYGSIGDTTALQKHVPTLVLGPGNQFRNPTVSVIKVLSNGGYDGGSHPITSLALLSNGEVYACGYGGQGQIGNGLQDGVNNRWTRVETSAGVPLSGITKIGILGGDAYISCYALNTAGALYAWGYNGTGQLGIGNVTLQTRPVRVVTSNMSNTTIIDIYTSGIIGGNGSLYVKAADGAFYACGNNNYGQLGLGDTANTSVLTRITALDNKNISYIRATYANAPCAIAVSTTATQQLWATGHNGQGQLGLNHATDVHVFTAVKFYNASGIKDVYPIYTNTLGGMVFVMTNDNEIYGTGCGRWTPFDTVSSNSYNYRRLTYKLLS